MVIDGLLDTSIPIDFLRGFQSARDWLTGLGRQRLAITPIVWMETVQGATNKLKRDAAIRFLKNFHLEHPTADDNRWAMRQLAALSHGLHLEDAMIASVAARLEAPLYTTNLRHYRPLPALDPQHPYL